MPCCAVRACGARCPAAQRCAPYYTAPLRARLHGVSEVHEGFVPSPRDPRVERSTGTYLLYLALRTYGMEFVTFLTLLTLPFPTVAASPVVFITPPYPVTARVCQSTRPYRTACYWHGYTDQLPPRPLLTGRYGFGFGTPNGRISCPYARSPSCSAKSSSSSPSSSSSSSSSSFSSSALP